MEVNFPKLEEKILKYWKDAGIFKKSIKQRAKARNFVFYEGPPTANAKAGIHHILARVFKDIVCRYKTMQGFRVLRKAGWDTHGLPVELEIEKKLGLKSKKDIEKYGIAAFNKKCKESVWLYKQDWEKLTERIGFWLDMEHPYITYNNDYIETLWWIIKQLHQKGLLYQDYKVVPYCPRCGTSLSSHEVALGYENIKETSVYVKFKIKPNTYLLVWTTTPWTLPGNVAVAVNPKFTYVKVKVGAEMLILAKERLAVLGEGCKIIEQFKGSKLLGLKYEPLFKFAKPDKKAWFVVGGDFVSLEEGTGLVHLAPAFGEDDMQVAKKNNLPVLLNVDETGRFKKEVKNWAGKWVKDVDPLIIADLGKRGLLYKEELYAHDYPFCWRCHSPLLYYAKESWFINMQKVKKQLIANNQKINWVPAHLKEGRFGEWLKKLKDWAFSRERYWGTPLPIWQCQKCDHREVIGGKQDLLSQKFTGNKYFFLRHGESLINIKKLSSCWPEKIHSPLTKKGELQIKRAAQKLRKEKIDLIFSSDLLRTKQTAEIIRKELGLKLKLDRRLRDIGVGIFNEKPLKDIGKFWNKGKKLTPLEHYSIRFQIAPPKGENYIEIQKRMYDFVREIDRKYQGKNILIISHKRPITLLEKLTNGYSTEKFVEIITRDKEIKTGEPRKLELKILPYNENMELDFHRPYIDQVKFKCPKCSGSMKRVPEVIDCWFDSGAMPFAQDHYPFEKNIQFPADYISEAIDQTRGWFYTLLAVSTLLGRGTPYKNVISLGHVLDEKGEKMSKSKGNVFDPWYIVEKYGADTARWYFYTVNQPGDVKLFAEKDLAEALKKFILTYWNSYLFFETYGQKKATFKSQHILDKWVVSKLNELIQIVANKLDKYDVTGAARAIEGFVINDLSLWYIRRARRRFQKPKTTKELWEASGTLSHVLSTLSKLTAPFVPFLSERIFQDLTKKPSCHLADWPKADKRLISQLLNRRMEKARDIVTTALAARAKAGIKVRQPLPCLQIREKLDRELVGLVKEEINVKKITFGKSFKLETKITPELREEGMVREVIRQIQEMRKKAGLKPKDKILVRYSGDDELNKILIRNKKFILKEAKVKDLMAGDKPKQVFDVERELKVDQKTIWLAIKKL